MFGNTNTVDNLSRLTKNVDNKILNWLADLHSTMSKDKLDLRQIDKLINVLQHYAEDAKEAYINTLLYPETTINMKIPTLFPIPSTTFQMHLVSTNVNPNTAGNLAWVWNPFFLMDSSFGNPAGTGDWSTFYVNNAENIGNVSSANFFVRSTGINTIPAYIYGNYRLVSASIVVTYVGRMDIVSGVLGIGIGLNNSGIGTPGQVTPALNPVASDANAALFGNFIQVDNLYYSERTQTANGVRAIYFPIDDKFTNFYPLYTTSGGPGNTLANTFVSGFYFAGYGQGLPNTPNSLRFDFYLNYEAIVTPQFNNFIPQTTGNSQNVNVIQTASDVINTSPSLVVKAGSDIPGKTSDNVGSMGMLTKLVKDDETILPGMDVIKKMIYKNNY
jgi:hypothetical protein